MRVVEPIGDTVQGRTISVDPASGTLPAEESGTALDPVADPVPAPAPERRPRRRETTVSAALAATKAINADRVAAFRERARERQRELLAKALDPREE